MAKEVIMPQLGLTMQTGTIAEWLKKEGDYIKKGEPLLVVIGDKATIEVESPYSGYLKRIVAQASQEVPVMQVIAYIGEKDEEIVVEVPRAAITESQAAQAPSPGGEGRARVAETPRAGRPAADATPRKRKRIRASPVAKRLAAELGVDLSGVKGTGPDGLIGKQDVLAAKEAMSQAGPALAVEQAVAIASELKLTGIKKLVAERTKASYLDAPHIHLTLSCDMREASRIREQANQLYQGDAHITYTDIIIWATAQALKSHRLLNATLREDSIVIFADINIGLATATDEGLVVPVLRGVDRLSLLEISAARQELTERVKAGKQTLDDLSGGTFTITNLGMFGIESFEPIITPGQAAILGVGKVKMAPVVDETGDIRASPVMSLCLACDHRVADGVDGARFLSDLKAILENPAGML
jgi:pyruvate dehydrogenase E2 component (dihydrolipoamide acetyltransferase)